MKLLFRAPLFAQEYMKRTADNFNISVPIGWFAQYTKTPNAFILMNAS